MTRLTLIALVVFISAAIASPARGHAQQTGVAAEIRTGNCDEIGDVVAPLVEARLPAGERRGHTAAMPATNSFTTVPLSLETLTVSDHAIVVPFPVGEELVACGDIAGTLTEAGALIVGISPQGEVDMSGIAYLSPSADPAQTNVSLFVSGEGLDTFLASTFLPLAVAEEDAARFAEALAARSGSPSLAGPFAGQLVQREGIFSGTGSGVATTDFSATATFVNPTEQTETPWDVGFAFHGTPELARVITVDSGGIWRFTDPVTGMLAAGPLTTFDATPGATNTLDLIVEGTTALLGVNGELATRIDLPPPTASEVSVVTGGAVEGRQIVYRDFEVWGGPGTTAQAAAPSPGSAQDDDALFAAALAARDGASRLAGPFGGKLPQSMAGVAARPAGLTTTDFSATVTFMNPQDPSGAPWDAGLYFRLNPEQSTVQEVYFDSNGFWYYTDFPNGIQQSGTVPSFDTSSRGTNTIDLIVEGTTALVGMNGQFVARLELPPATPSDVMPATDFVVGNIVEGREIIYTNFAVWDAPDLASLPATPTAAAPDDASRFAAALAVRKGAASLGGPSKGTLRERQGFRALHGAGITTEDFSATVAFTNPTERTETPWEIGFAFHRVGDTFQDIFVDSEGFWYYQGTRSGFVPTFSVAPGGTNTLDLVVDGTEALFGVNGEFVASIDLPPPTASDVSIGTGFSVGHTVEGREIAYSNFEVWR